MDIEQKLTEYRNDVLALITWGKEMQQQGYDKSQSVSYFAQKAARSYFS